MIKVSTPSAAAFVRLLPAPPVTMPILLQTGGPPGRSIGGVPIIFFNRSCKILRFKRAFVFSPIN